MATSQKKEHLNKILNEHLSSIQQTMPLLQQTAPSSADKISWKQVVQMGEKLSKEANIVGMVWMGEKPEVRSLEENMSSFFNTLQGFLLLSHGSTVGAGPTLASFIAKSVLKVVDSSVILMKDSVSSFGSREQKDSIPKLVGAVWESCNDLKSTPSSNVTAIGKTLSQVTVSIRDVLREVKELKEASPDLTDGVKASSEADSKLENDDDLDDDDLGNDLSPEEMRIAELTSSVVSDTYDMMGKLICSIVGVLKQERDKPLNDTIVSLEKVVKLCQLVGLQIDELGASLYPPLEIPAMRDYLGKISDSIGEIQVVLKEIEASSEDFGRACTILESSIRELDFDLGCINATDLESKLENLTL